MKKNQRHKVKKSGGSGHAPRMEPLHGVKVVGAGGGGQNAVSRMRKDFVRGVEFIAINTDHQDLDHADADTKIYIGKNLTKGLGTGMNPDLGQQAAEENRSEISEAIGDAHLVFLTAGFGGGTGTGALPIIAEVAKQAGALTVAVVTKPFSFEGSERQRIAQEGLMKLKDKVDALIVVPNDRIFSIIAKDTTVLKAFAAIDEVLRNALAGIVELVMTPGIINIDFADVRSIMQDAGSALIGVGIAAGQDRATNAVQLALHSPLLELSAEGAKGVLLGISGSSLNMNEINDAAKMVSQIADPGARIIFGAYHDRRLKPTQIKVTLIATGFNGNAVGGPLFPASFGTSERNSTFLDGFKEFETGDRARVEGDPFKNVKPISEDRLSNKPNFKKSEPLATLAKEVKEPEELAKKPTNENDVWDIPTFLRRKKR